MRKLASGWYETSAEGPLVRHVPGFVVETPWDPRMQAPQPVERPEAPGAAHAEDETWTSTDRGKTYVEIVDGRVAHLQYSGTGTVLGSAVRQRAELFTRSWIEMPEEAVHTHAPNGVPIPCWSSPDQPTHLFVWTPADPKRQGSVALLRVEGAKAYAHIEWVNRANPKCHPNWVLERGRWWWQSPVKALFLTPANVPGVVVPHLITP